MNDIVSIISRERLDGYSGNADSEKLKNYYENRCLAIRAAHKCAEIEIYLRNKFISCFDTPDDCLSLIQEAISSDCLSEKLKLKIENKTLEQFISSLTFGELLHLIDFFKMKAKIFDLEKMDFRKYNPNNRDSLKIDHKWKKLSNLDKNSIALVLVQNIRNRALHWENLQKIRFDKSNKEQPRITMTYKDKNYFGILPRHILGFLDDLIFSVGVDEMVLYKDIERLICKC